jgi:hypothetical protein
MTAGEWRYPLYRKGDRGFEIRIEQKMLVIEQPTWNWKLNFG